MAKIDFQIEWNENRIECLNDEISERKAIIRFALDEPQIDGEKIAKAAKYIDECQVMIKMLKEENEMLKTLR